MVKAVYIHIPFCKTICNYCDFCKVFYNTNFVNKYLDNLEKEIKDKYKGELINTIYIGGGTPNSLSLSELERLFKIINIFKKDEDIEFTIECNIEDLDIDKIKLFKNNGINRVSIGVQSLKQENIDFLGRHHTKDMVKSTIKVLKENNINNINIDLIYALNNQTISDLKEDLEEYIKLDITHISTYSLMIEPNTKLYLNKVKPIDEELDSKMYQFICSYLNNHNFIHYEISNFCKGGYESKHNLVYWNNKEYYGFGVGASGYINNIRYDNTKSITNYLKGKYLDNENVLDINTTIENEFILGLRKIKGINKKNFKNKYNKEICDIIKITNLLKLGKLEENEEYIFIPEKYLYISNSILVDLIGGIMNKEDFFRKEIRYIRNARLMDNIKKMVNLLPDYFFEIPASSTGKYHPSFALGEGGLVRHTKAAVRIGHELLENECIGNVFTNDEKDMIIMSLIMHDGCKSGLTKGEYTVVNHPSIVAKLIMDNASKLTLEENELKLICGMIESHMGPYNKDFKGNTVLPLPSNKYQKFVHMCDLLASKKFLDIKFNNNEIVE